MDSMINVTNKYYDLLALSYVDEDKSTPNNIVTNFYRIYIKDSLYDSIGSIEFNSLNGLIKTLKSESYPLDLINSIEAIGNDDCTNNFMMYAEKVCTIMADILYQHTLNINKSITYIPYEGCDHLLYQYGEIIHVNSREYKVRIGKDHIWFNKNDVKIGIKF